MADALFNALIRHSDDVFFRYRILPEPVMEFISDSVVRLTGFTPQDYYREPELALQRAHPEDLPAVLAMLNNERPPGEPLQFRVVHQDGRQRWVEQISVPILDEHGTLVAVEGVVRDINDHVVATERLRQREAEVAETQALAKLGSWSWDLRTNMVVASDEMMRISALDYPGNLVPVDLLMDMVHPGDLDRFTEWINSMVAGKEPGVIEFRMVRADGEVFWLHSRAVTIVDEEGSARLTGTALDITELKLAQLALAESDRRYVATLETAPDGVISVGTDGRIVFVNDQAEVMFGYAKGELAGRPVEDLLPVAVRARHVAHRAAYLADPKTRPMGSGLALSARRKDGTEFPVDVSLSTIDGEAGPLVTAFVRDVTERKRIEAAARAVEESRVRRSQALEINDRVVQGLAAAAFAIESADMQTAAASVSATLDAARAMMADLLAWHTGTVAIKPGDLVRAEPAALNTHAAGQRKPPPATEQDDDPIRVVVADDTEDIRMVLGLALGRHPSFAVVAEVENGAEAVEAAERHQPDIVLLDLAMPVMDGLQATPEILARTPDTKVVVLSGYASGDAAEQATRAGAAAYIEKGRPLAELTSLLFEITGRSAPVQDSRLHLLQPERENGDLDLFLSSYSHEMRTVMTVVQGIAQTLIERRDMLSSAFVGEMFESLERNTRQMASLVDSFSDASQIVGGRLTLLIEQVDVAQLVRETVADLQPLTHLHTVDVDTPPSVMAPVDAARLRQVIANLVTNAAKFSDPGTRIAVTLSPNDAEVEVRVADQGPGIPGDQAGRVFGRFTRLSRRGGGLGLGLYIAREIMRAHGGDLVLEKTGPWGSVFLVRVPALRHSQEPASDRT